MKAVDLARLGGISVQQVRNYVDLGFLPAVERTASGYRVFTTEHAHALAVTRKAAKGYGWPRARAVMGAIHRGDLATALAEVDASHAELDRERADIATVLAAFETATADSPTPPFRRGARIGDVAAAVGVHTPVLRLWEQRGLLRPAREKSTGYRVYDETEFRNAHLIALLRRANYPFAIVEAALDELRTSGSPERARTELAAREHDLHRRSLERLDASAAVYSYVAPKASEH
jgi:DNA-binding transcriptional MerR regulator